MTDLAKRIKAAKRVFIIGNGGSSANASHLCNDLETCGIRAYVMNEATKSAWENDYNHTMVFEKWIDLHGDQGDLLLALSGSGTSKNILYACAMAKVMEMDVYTLFGNERGQDMESAEEHQLRVCHELKRALRK